MTRRRKGYGQGSVTLEDGKYRVRIPDGHGKHLTIGYYETEARAQEHRREALLARNDQQVDVTLRAWGEVWLPTVRRQRNHRSNEGAWHTHVLESPVADISLGSLTSNDMHDLAEMLANKRARRSVLKDGKRQTVELARPLSRPRALSVFGMVRRALDAAKRRGHIAENPADGVEVPQADAPAAEEVVLAAVTYLEEDEYDTMVAHSMPPLEQRVVFTLAATQGLRQGELAGLDWERVDWTGHGWWVARSWNDNTTKNGKSRWQQLLPVAERVLREWWIAQGQPTSGIMFPSRAVRGRAELLHLIARSSGGIERSQLLERSGWARPTLNEALHHLELRGAIVVTGSRGCHLRATKPAGAAPTLTVVRYARGHDWGWSDHHESDWVRLGWWRRMGLRTRVRFHDLRDTAATHLLSGTWGKPWSIEAVSDFLGHSSIEVTRRRYAHITRRAAHRLALSAGGKPAGDLPEGAPARGDRLLSHVCEIVNENSSDPTQIRTGDLRLRKTQVGQQNQVVTDVPAGVRHVQELTLQIEALIDAGQPVGTALTKELGSAIAALGQRFTMLGVQLVSGGADCGLALVDALHLVRVTSDFSVTNEEEKSEAGGAP